MKLLDVASTVLFSTLTSLLFLPTTEATPLSAASPDGEPTAGIRWETSIEEAKSRAVREGKGIFMLHLFGELDEAMC